MEKEFIENLFKEKAKNDSNSEDLANTLNILSKTVFGDVNRFVFELLQNADDSPTPESSDNLNVTFHLFDNYLLFSHNGKHFDASDVKGISRVGSLDSRKDKEIEKTGYKGIGFKSVFRTSDCVQIFSNGYKFKFDKNHSLWKEDKSFPWQVIPIWDDNLPDEVAPFIDHSSVNTIIQINNKEILYSEILEVFEDCQIILFLRNVNSIQFKRNGIDEFQIVKKSTGNDTCELYYSDHLKSSWYLSEFTEEINESLRSKLSKLSDEECPIKLKEAKRTKLTIAALIEDGSLKSLSNTIIYNYLPTKVNYGFPYIVNGDFITNAERTQLLLNDWNEFLLSTIARLQIDLLVQLSKTEFKSDVLQLLKEKFPYTSNGLKIAFINGLSAAMDEVAFIPDISGTKLLKAKECLIDSLEYSKYFPHEHIIDLYSHKPNLIYPNLAGSDKLISFGASRFNEDNITELLNSSTFISAATSDKTFNFRFICFFFNQTFSPDTLKQAKFILDSSGDLKAPMNLYFPSNSVTKTVSFTELSFIDTKIFTEIDKYEDLKKWMIELGVKFPKNIEILRKSIFPMINQDRITDDNTLEITHFAFKLFYNGELTDNDYSTLRKIKLLSNNGLKVAQDTYLANAYNPRLKLEELVPEQNYVSKDYIIDGQSIEKWKSFFLRLFVKEKITVVKHAKTERGKLSSLISGVSGYLTWIDSNGYYDSIYTRYKNSGQHYVSNLRYFFFLSHLKTRSFSKLFWDILLNDWSSYQLDDPKTLYHHYGGTNEIPDYLQYHVRNFQSIPATDKKCYKSSEVYAPRFKNIIKEKYPVADFKSTLLSKEQINYLGLKQYIEIDKCISLLMNLTSKTVSNEVKKQVFAIYDEILKSYKEGNRITVDISSLKLLSLNNTYQTADNLHYFSITSLSPPVNSEKFIQIPNSFTDKDKELFCKVLNISVLTYEDLDFSYESRENEDTLRNRLLEILPYLSTIIAHKDSSNFNQVLRELQLAIHSTVIFKADTLNLLHKDQEGTIIFNSSITTWHDGDDFYVTGNWSNPLTLYSLCSNLCEFLNIENIDRELSLFLQIDVSAITDWLIDQGYELPNSDSNMSQEYEVNEDETLSIVEDVDLSSDYSESVTIEEFEPEVEAKAADSINVKINNISHQSVNYCSDTKDYTKLKNEAVKIDIGRWSEEYIFNYLKSQDKYTSVNWLNEDKEAYLPYDFVVIEDQIEKFIEVKGTPSKDKREFYMSKNEWNFMFEKKDDYAIYRLFNAGKKEGLEIKIIEKPYLLIENGSMLPDTISVYI